MTIDAAALMELVASMEDAPRPVGICPECGRWYFSHPDEPNNPNVVLAHDHDIKAYGIQIEERYASTLKALTVYPKLGK